MKYAMRDVRQACDTVELKYMSLREHRPGNALKFHLGSI